MATDVRWIPTNVHVYQAICTEHHDALTPFYGCTECAEYEDDEQHIMTAWGFKDADAPLIKSIREGTPKAPRFSYYIALVKEIPDGDA